MWEAKIESIAWQISLIENVFQLHSAQPSSYIVHVQSCRLPYHEFSIDQRRIHVQDRHDECVACVRSTFYILYSVVQICSTRDYDSSRDTSCTRRITGPRECLELETEYLLPSSKWARAYFPSHVIRATSMNAKIEERRHFAHWFF